MCRRCDMYRQWNIKKNETMSFATIWKDLEIVILSKESQLEKGKYCTIFLICGIQKNYTKEFIYKTEIELQIYETILWLPGKSGGRDKLGDRDWHINITFWFPTYCHTWTNLCSHHYEVSAAASSKMRLLPHPPNWPGSSTFCSSALE